MRRKPHSISLPWKRVFKSFVVVVVVFQHKSPGAACGVCGIQETRSEGSEDRSVDVC